MLTYIKEMVSLVDITNKVVKPSWKSAGNLYQKVRKKWRERSQRKNKRQQFIFGLMKWLGSVEKDLYNHWKIVYELKKQFDDCSFNLPPNIEKLKNLAEELSAMRSDDRFREIFRKELTREGVDECDRLFRILAEIPKVDQLERDLDCHYDHVRVAARSAIDGIVGPSDEEKREMDSAVTRSLAIDRSRLASTRHTWNDGMRARVYSAETFKMNICGRTSMRGIEADLGRFIFKFFESQLAEFCKKHIQV